jgi:serine/threonine-protein kinase HipA
LVELPRLLGASMNLERDTESDDELRLLLEAGSSLGGARPKAQVTDGGTLVIAKFPRVTQDPWSVSVWERIALEMAAASGIRAASSRLVDVAGRDVLLVDRFDRARDGGRIGYVSALTMLEARDNDPRSYLEIAEVIETSSPQASEDLRELWRRVAFSILISNSDDHLRNHGFLRRGPGWVLSPAFDLNPSPDSPGRLSTAIATPGDHEADMGLLVDLAEYFRVADPAAELRPIIEATASWRQRAARHGVDAEVSRLAPAFEHDNRLAARRIADI